MPTTRLKMRRRNEKGDLKKRPITMPERPKRLDRLLDPVMDNDGTAIALFDTALFKKMNILFE